MEETPNAVSSPAENTAIETWTEEQHSQWLKDGSIPAPKEAETKSSEPKPEEKPAAEAKPATESETVLPKQEPRPGEKRKGQLASEIQELLRQRAELRQETERLQAERAKPAEAPSKPESTRPKWEDFEGDWGKYEEATAKYYSDQANKAAREAVSADRQERELAAQKETTEKRNQEIESGWNKRVTEFTKTHPDVKDFAPAVEAMVDAGLIPENSFLDQWILFSENGPALAWHFSQNPEEVLRIGELHPISAARELAVLETSFSPKAVSNPAPDKPIAILPKPPNEVSARSAPPGDEVEAAWKQGNIREYMEKKNARELAASRK